MTRTIPGQVALALIAVAAVLIWRTNESGTVPAPAQVRSTGPPAA